MNKRILLVILLSLFFCTGCEQNSNLQAPSLTISGGISDSSCSAAAAQSLGITINETDNFFFTNTMLMNQLVSHDPNVDIYYIEGGMISTNAIFRKDFALPLTNSKLVEQISGMYDVIQDAVLQDQDIMGAPLLLSSNSGCLAYQISIYNDCTEEGYELPASWMQLLEQIVQWDDALWQEQISPIDMTPRMLLQSTLDMLMAWQQKAGVPYSFTSDQAIQVIDAAFRAGKVLAAHQSEQMQNILFHRQGLTVGRTELEGFTPHALPLFDGEEKIIPMRLCIAFVNPYSKNQALAQQYLSAYYDAMDADLLMALTPKANQNIESPTAVSQIESLQASISDLEDQLLHADAQTDTQSIDEQLEQCKEQLRYAEEHRYRIDASSLAVYGDLIESGVVLTEQLWQEQNVSKLIDQLLQEEISVEDFCQELERILRMREAEDA
jgi:hypothetical protein